MSVKKYVFIGISIIILGVLFWSFSGKNANQASVFDVPDSEKTILGEGFVQYVHPEIGFSLEYPKDLEVKSFNEKDGGETIIFQKKGDTSEMPREQKTGFQIFVVPFEDDSKGLTLENIKEDLPGVDIEKPLEVIIGEKADRPVHAFVFWSNDARIGKTRELWFVDNGYLFEVTTYEHLDVWLAQIMSTWNFIGSS